MSVGFSGPDGRMLFWPLWAVVLFGLYRLVAWIAECAVGRAPEDPSREGPGQELRRRGLAVLLAIGLALVALVAAIVLYVLNVVADPHGVSRWSRWVVELVTLALLTFLLPPAFVVTAIRALAQRAEEKRYLRLTGRKEGTELERVELLLWSLWKGLLVGLLALVPVLPLVVFHFLPGPWLLLVVPAVAGIVRATVFYRKEKEVELRWRQEDGAAGPA